MREEQLVKNPPLRDVLRKAVRAPLVAIMTTASQGEPATMKLQLRFKLQHYFAELQL